jgi:hypothetical protein
VVASAPDDAWAVGQTSGSSNSQELLILHWDGQSWTRVTTAALPAAGEFLDIAAVSAHDIWATGSQYIPSEGKSGTLTMHWNGSAWTSVPSPSPGQYNNRLEKISVTASGVVWAGGYTGSSFENYAPLLLRWNGSQWINMPTPPGLWISALGVLSETDAWAAVSDKMYRWNGSGWSETPTQGGQRPNDQFFTILPLGPQDVWAVGVHTHVEHYAPYPCDYDQSSPTATPPTVTSTPPLEPTLTPVITPCTIDGSVVPGPHTGDNVNRLNAVSVISADNVWAVGYYWVQTPDFNGKLQTLVHHWDGTAWSVVPSPNVGSGTNVLQGVVGIASNDVWAVGYTESGNKSSTLILHWDGVSWSVVPSPNVAALPV